MKQVKLESRLLKRITRKRCDVFLRSDFKDLGGYNQIGRALRLLVNQGKLIRLGQGLYGRALPSPLDGTPVPVKGLRSMATEALNRLGVKTYLTQLEIAYNVGDITQVPSGRTIAVTKRVRRKIGYKEIFVRIERVQ